MNPGARRGTLLRDRAVRSLTSEGVVFELVETSGRGHAAEVVRRERDRFEAILVLGGDGTVMEVVGAAAESGLPVGVLPGGTGNLTAGALGVPLDVRRAVPALLRGRTRQIDLGRFSTGEYFAFAAGLGIDAAMIEETTATLKRRLGILGYVVTGARRALRLDRFDLHATVDGEPIRASATLALVVNAGSLFGGALTLGPDIRPDDGLLDLCIFSPRSRAELLALAQRMLRGDHRPRTGFQFRKGKRIRLESFPVRSVQADGEMIGSTPVEIEVVPRAATFLVPA